MYNFGICGYSCATCLSSVSWNVGRTFISISRGREILLIFENIGRRIKRVLDYYKLLHSTLT